MTFLASILVLFPSALSAAAPEPADVIRRIYRDHQPWKRQWIDTGDPAILARYFDDSLVGLFRGDREDSERRKELPCLDFDPFLQGQDFDDAGITDLRIREIRRGQDAAYEVSFTGRSKAWKNWNVRAVYDLVETPGGWRVHDIEFPNGGSLRKVLSCGQGAADQSPAALRAAVEVYAKADGDRETPRFRHALVDLDGDARDDAVVLLLGPTWCGSGGCTMVVFRGVASGFTPVSRSTITGEPVRVSPETERGWHTLIVRTREGDALMRFDGKRYPLNPSVQPKATSAQLKAAKTVIE